jgi:hypothetical protein
VRRILLRRRSRPGKLAERPTDGAQHTGDTEVRVKQKKKTKGKPAAAKKVQAPGQHLSAPELFFRRLHERLAALGLDTEAMDTKTSLDSPPPCFALRTSSYEEWLAAALNAEPPLRLDMAREPNYCWDCTARFRRHATKKGVCLFPHTKSEVVREFGERLHVGVSHSRSVPLEEFGTAPDLARLVPLA